MDITVIINQLIQLFLLILLGYFLCRISLIDREMNQKLTKLVLQVTMPCMVLDSVLSQSGERDIRAVGLVFLIFGIYYLLMPFVGYLLCLLLRLPQKSRGLYMFMEVYENIGFMGIPLIHAIYGPKGVLYTAIANIIFNLTSFGYGPRMLSIGTDTSARFNIRNLLSPGFLLSLLAILLYFTGLTFPSVVAGPIGSVGAMTTPLAMMLIGSTLATMKFSEVFRDSHVYPYILARQIILPLVVFPLLKYAIQDPLILGVFFILFIMPAASNCVLFATNYQNDEVLAARTVFISTMLCILTIPLLVLVCPL